MRKPFRKSLLSLAIAHALGSGIGWPATALATDTQQPSAAAAFAQNRDLQRELIELKNAVVASPEDAEARLRLGQLYLRMGDAAGAEKELQRARDLGLQDYELALALGETWIVQGQFRRVFTDDALLAAQGPEQLAALKTLQGTSLMVEGRLDEAREHFTEALLQVAEYGPALLGIAEAELEADEVVAAQQAMTRARLATGLEPAELLRVEGNLAFKLGRFEEAADFYDKALAQRSGDPVLLRGLAVSQLRLNQLQQANDTLDALLRLTPNSADVVALKAQAAFRSQDYDAAAALAERVMESAHEQTEIIFIAGAAAYQLGEPQRAREYLQRYIALRPDMESARRMLGSILLDSGDEAGAREILKPLTDRADEDATLSALLARAALQSGQVKEALARFEHAAALAPADTGLRASVAALQLLAGDSTSGREAVERIVAEEGETAAASALLLAQHDLARGDSAAALTTARSLREAHPDAAAPWVIEGLALLRMGELADAEAAFQRASELEPNNTDAVTGRAEILMRRGQAEAAVQLLQGRFGAKVDNPEVQLSIAVAEAAAGRSDAALTRLEQIVEQNPRSTRARAALSNAYLRSGRLEAAEQLIADAPNPAAAALQVLAARTALAGARPNGALMILEDMQAAGEQAQLTRLLMLARAHTERGDFAAAADAIGQAVALAPGSPSVLAEQTRLTLLNPDAPQSELQQALRNLGQLMESHGPEEAGLLELRGLAALRVAGKGQEGLQLLREARQRDRNVHTTVLLANAMAGQGDVAGAVKLLDAWIDLDTGHAALARVNRARLKTLQGDYAAAAVDLDSAIQHGADEPRLPVLLAWNLALSGDVQAAMALRTQGADLPSSDDILALHVRALKALNDAKPQEALVLLQQALGAGQAPPQVRLDLARTLLALGQDDAARRQLRELADSDLRFPEREKAQSLLIRLEGR